MKLRERTMERSRENATLLARKTTASLYGSPRSLTCAGFQCFVYNLQSKRKNNSVVFFDGIVLDLMSSRWGEIIMGRRISNTHTICWKIYCVDTHSLAVRCACTLVAGGKCVFGDMLKV